MTTQQDTAATIDELGRYEYGWHDSDAAGTGARRGLSEEVVRDISAKKNEPQWMLDLRLKGLRLFNRKPMPVWGSDLNSIDFENIKYFVRSTEKQAASWDELPEDIKNTYDRLGIPEADVQHKVIGGKKEKQGALLSWRKGTHVRDFSSQSFVAGTLLPKSKSQSTSRLQLSSSLPAHRASHGGTPSA